VRLGILSPLLYATASSSPVRGLRRKFPVAERAAAVELRRSGAISDAVEREVFRELDLEDARLGGASAAYKENGDRDSLAARRSSPTHL